MFICAITKKPSQPREPMIKLVVETRSVTYQNWVEDEDGQIIERLSKGTEIVREIGVTKEGYEIWQRLNVLPKSGLICS